MEKLRSSVILVVALLAACAEEPLPKVHRARSFPNARPGDPLDVSLVQLLANPAEYDGLLVRVEGFCHLEFEGDALYLHREDSDRMISKNAMWLALERGPDDRYRELSDKYVLVEGTVDATENGHLGAFSGTIKDITRMHPTGSRAEIMRNLRPPPPLPSK